MSAVTAAELAELPRLIREAIDSPSPERAARVRELCLARPPNYDYRKAWLVARVLSSDRLKQRRKWCTFAQELVRDPGVENRLIDQAMRLIALEKRAGIRLRHS